MRSMRSVFSFACLLSAVIFISVLPAQAGVATLVSQPQDPAAKAVIAALLACGEQKLGGKSGIDLAYAMGDQANRQIVAYCKQGKKDKAHEVALYYAGTEQGKIAMECAAQLKPLVEQSAIQKMLGQYKDIVADIMNGQVPMDVCVGIHPNSQYYY